MGKWTAERLAAASGAVFIVLFLVGFFLPGKSPDPGDSRSKWISYVLDNTRELKVGLILIALAFALLLWFAATLATTLRAAGEERLGNVALAGGIATSGIAFVAVGIEAAVTWRIAADEPAIVRGLIDVAIVFTTVISFPAAVLVYATALAAWRTRVFPQWYGALSGLGALAIVFSGAALSHTGFYAPDGAYGIITLIVFLAWVLVTSALLILKAEAAQAPTAGAVTA